MFLSCRLQWLVLALLVYFCKVRSFRKSCLFFQTQLYVPLNFDARSFKLSENKYWIGYIVFVVTFTFFGWKMSHASRPLSAQFLWVYHLELRLFRNSPFISDSCLSGTSQSAGIRPFISKSPLTSIEGCGVVREECTAAYVDHGSMSGVDCTWGYAKNFRQYIIPGMTYAAFGRGSLLYIFDRSCFLGYAPFIDQAFRACIRHLSFTERISKTCTDERYNYIFEAVDKTCLGCSLLPGPIIGVYTIRKVGGQGPGSVGTSRIHLLLVCMSTT